jgi:hypothetical protein
LAAMPGSPVRAASMAATFLHRFTFSHVRQLGAVATRLLAVLRWWPRVLPGTDPFAFPIHGSHRLDGHARGQQGKVRVLGPTRAPAAAAPC